MNFDPKIVQKALMTAKMLSHQVRQPKPLYASKGGAVDINPNYEQNLAKHMEGAHPSVLNEDGTPKVLYRGESSIHPERNDISWFTPDIEGANSYAFAKKHKQPIILPAYLNIKNPAKREDIIKSAKNIGLINDYGWNGFELVDDQKVIDDLKKHGFDGIHLNFDYHHGSEKEMESYATFYPHQIKSAIGNNGDFAPGAPIHRETGGEVDADHPENYISYSINSDTVFDHEGNESEGPDYHLIDKIYVHPSQRGQGRASKMLKNAIGEMRKSHPHLPIKINALPFDENSSPLGLDMEELVRFYEKHGFDVENTEGNAVGMGMPPLHRETGGEVEKHVKDFLRNANHQQNHLNSFLDEGEHDLPHLHSVDDVMSADPTVKQLAFGSLEPHLLEKETPTLHSIVKKHGLTASPMDRKGHYWHVEDPQTLTGTTIRWMKDHQQQRGGGFNPHSGERSGDSDIDVHYDPDGILNVHSSEMHPKFSNIANDLHAHYHGKNVMDVLKVPHKAIGGEVGSTVDENGVPDFTPPKLRGTQIVKEPGGQWLDGGAGESVEEALRPLRKEVGFVSPEEILSNNQVNEQYPHDIVQRAHRAKAVNDFVGKQLTRYVKNDMGTERDPIRALAERGILHVNPDQLNELIRKDIILQPNRHFKYEPALGHSSKTNLASNWERASDLRIEKDLASSLKKYGRLFKYNTWLEKVDPNTEVNRLHNGIHKYLGFDHLVDELHNSVNPESGLPNHLQLTPESLSRMSVPQAVQHVHNINKWREENLADANKKLAFNPATFLHKDYPDSDYAWYQLKPSPYAKLPVPAVYGLGKHRVEGAFPKQFETEAEAHQYIKEFPERTRNSNDQGQFNAILEKLHDRPLRYTGQLNEELEPYKQGEDKHLKDALEYEGDTMGHCIGAGGYFDDVMSGDSNIYSLRNKKTGAPHVTVQTIHHPIYTWDDISHVYGKEKAQQLYDSEVNDPDNPENFQNVVNQLPIKKVLAIEQIKGKGNKKPVDRYIPYVQDFVKSGNWDTVGDIQNTGLRLMDGRYTPYSHLVHQMTKAGEDVPKYMTEEEYKAAEKRHYPQAATGGAIIAKAVGGSIDPQKAIRRALMVAREPHMAKGGVPPDDLNDESTRILVPAIGSGGIKGIVVPRHMLEGKVYAGDGPKSGERVAGMNEINAARAAVYGPENRDPLNVGQIRKIHEQTLAEHFSKPIAEQKSIEKAALDKLRKAKHINNDANTLDESEKTDTVKYEPDSYEPWTSKGIAGHALYTSGHGATQVRHVINTCPGQTVGCGGGVDENGIVDTSKGTCFAPNAESQYVNAAVRRACHEQAKFDPAMTKDWIFAHTGSLRSASEKADKKRQKTMFRPNVVDETDTSSRHVLEGLNEQRKAKGLPMIIANSYGKTDELHDPENGYYVTHSNIGPKVKNGASISDNIGRDKQRIRRTITATTASGKDFTNIQGNITPPKNSYMVTDVKRGSDLDKRMQGAITHAKYWSYPRSQQELSPEEISEGAEAHFDGDGNATTVDKSHYGHTTIDGRRYDYQKQHIIHPRLVSVPVTKTNKNTKIKTTEIKKIPTDSRFKDNDFLPSEETRFKTKNGKIAGAILMTTPTESTSNLGHETEFTHHVGDSNVAHALQNNGEYEIDSPMAQEAARGNQYITPKPIEFKKHSKVYAKGGFVDEEENSISLPEQNFHAQAHLGHHSDSENDHKLHHGHRKILANSQIVDHALRLTAALRKR